MKKYKIKKLSEMMNLKDYQIFESEELLNPQYHMVNNDYKVDVEEMEKQNEIGNFGVTHSAFIKSWRIFLDYQYSQRKAGDRLFKKIEKEIDDCERWHEENGSLRDII